MLNLTAEMTDEEIVRALAGVDSSDQWLAIENADDETKARANRLWDVNTGTARSTDGESESGESEAQEPDPNVAEWRHGPEEIAEGLHYFVASEGFLYVYESEGHESEDYEVILTDHAGIAARSTGLIPWEAGRFGEPDVTGRLEDEGAESEGQEGPADGWYRYHVHGGQLVVTRVEDDPDGPVVDETDNPGFDEGARGAVLRVGGQWTEHTPDEEVPEAPPAPPMGETEAGETEAQQDPTR